jgi:hypothetical protein
MTLTAFGLLGGVILVGGVLSLSIVQVLGALLMLAGYLALRPPSWWRGRGSR